MLKTILVTLMTITVSLALSTAGHAAPSYIAGNGGMIIKNEPNPPTQNCNEHEKKCAVTFFAH